MDDIIRWLVIAGVLAVASVGGIMGLFAFLKRFMVVGKPNEVLVLSGRDHKLPDGTVVGYRVVHGGRTIRWPIIEQIQRVDLRLMPIQINIRGAYSEGGIPLDVHAIANVKVSSRPGIVRNAIERFLGRDRKEILRVAQETLEGNLRGVLATLTPEEVNENRLKFATELAKEAEPDLEKLGLEIETLKIQNVADDRDYLESIGRRRIAEVLKTAEVSESDATRTAEEFEAEKDGQADVAWRNAEAQVQKAENELRALKAQLDLQAKSEEERAVEGANAARAQAEQELQEVRKTLEALRLQADVVIPAEAQKVARQELAAGEAAYIAENGRAMAESLRMMTEVWREAGDDAMKIFIMQRLETIMERLAEAAKKVRVRQAAIIDGGDGQALPNYVTAFPGIVSGLFREVRETLGIDISEALGASGSGGPGGPGGGGKPALPAASSTDRVPTPAKSAPAPAAVQARAPARPAAQPRAAARPAPQAPARAPARPAAVPPRPPARPQQPVRPTDTQPVARPAAPRAPVVPPRS